MIPLETLRVASPCAADWDAMDGTDKARFCPACRKNVYNLSQMTRAEAEALVARTEGRLCVRFYTRADGTVLTQDCPVGLRAVRRRLVQKLSWAAAVLLSCLPGLGRGAASADATAVKKPAAKPPVARPHAGPGWTAGAPMRVRMGDITPLPPTMGKPVVPPPTMDRLVAPPRKKKASRPR